jgi:hypothetical protein
VPRVKLFKEEEALTKAMMIFWKKGYHDTSIQDLVDHLGINRASLLYTLLTGLRVTGKTRPNQKESLASVDAVLSLLD